VPNPVAAVAVLYWSRTLLPVILPPKHDRVLLIPRDVRVRTMIARSRQRGKGAKEPPFAPFCIIGYPFLRASLSLGAHNAGRA
jgi:hypothetical protein